MNHENINRASGAAIGFVIAFLIFLALIAIAKFSISVPAIDADRDATISKSLVEIRRTESIELANPGWVDQSRGIVRLPIETAMQIAAREWQNPAQARKDLIARAEKAAAPAPKNTKPKANPFE
jgi:hypothetical protein